VEIRSIKEDDVDFLEAMLFEAFFWDVTVPRPPRPTLRENPEFTKLMAHWGRRGDRGVVAEEDGDRTGAAWFRLWTPECHSYGFVDGTTPEVGMGVVIGYRRKGIGRALLQELIGAARSDRFRALSLSVNPLNPARFLYESLGFQKIGESGTSWTLRLQLE
jgi:ribosomal protein S18 acetylase RimI-like enzyme